MTSLTHKKKHTKKKFNEFIVKIDNEHQEYGEIISAKGSYRFEVSLLKNNETFNAKIRGTFIHGPNRQRIEKGDIVLLHPDLCSTDDSKYFIIHKYNSDDVKKLQKMGELTHINITDNKSTIIFESDVLEKQLNEIEINDEFINDI